MLLDQISSVVQENATYRDLLLNVYHTIGQALQIDNKEKEFEDGESGNSNEVTS